MSFKIHYCVHVRTWSWYILYGPALFLWSNWLRCVSDVALHSICFLSWWMWCPRGVPLHSVSVGFFLCFTGAVQPFPKLHKNATEVQLMIPQWRIVFQEFGCVDLPNRVIRYTVAAFCVSETTSRKSVTNLKSVVEDKQVPFFPLCLIGQA